MPAPTRSRTQGFRLARRAQSGRVLFDAVLLAANSDVRAQAPTPTDQYGTRPAGAKGRSGPTSTQLYLLHNPTSRPRRPIPLAHYLSNGMAEGARPKRRSSGGERVRCEFYLMAQSGRAAAGSTRWRISTQWWHEGRSPDPYFDVAYYSRTNPTSPRGRQPLQHYEHPVAGRGNPSARSAERVSGGHPDVAAAHINPLDHYLNYGFYEGRALAPGRRFQSFQPDADGSLTMAGSDTLVSPVCNFASHGIGLVSSSIGTITMALHDGDFVYCRSRYVHPALMIESAGF